jgi:putative membrane protein
MKQSHSLALLGATALMAGTFAAAPLLAQTAPRYTPTEQAAMGNPTTSSGYVSQAQSGDLFELEASKIGVQRAQNEQVRLFAQQMVDDHAAAANNLSLAASQAGVTATTPVLTVQQNARLDDLRKVSLSAFDKAYIVDQLKAHEQAIALHGTYSRNAAQTTLKTSSGNMTTVSEKHLSDAKKISSLLGSEG